MFVFKTNKNAPKYKLVKIDFSKSSDEPEWTDLVEEKDKVLQDVSSVNNNYMLLNYMLDCKVI